MQIQLKILPVLPLIILALASTARPQDDGSDSQPIKVITTIHADGSKTTMQTDPDNHTAEASNYDRANKLLNKIIYNLDDRGQAIGGSAYTAKGTLICKMRYVRDDANRVNEVDTYSPTGQLTMRQVYHYDANNRVVKIDTYDGNGNQVNGTLIPAATPPPPPESAPTRRSAGSNH